MKTLFLDIETAPNLVYCWGLWQQDISPNHMVDSSSTLCWAAKWQGSREVMFDSVHRSSEKRMLKGVHRLLDEADVVVHYNGKKFDVPTLNKEFILNDMLPPSPYKQLDLLQVSKSKFRFQSNKLDYVAKQLGMEGKVEHEGFQLWVKCMQGDDAAWRRMEKYNKGDVVQLEKVYDKMLPWIPNHPNRSTGMDCTKCGSKRLQSRGLTPPTKAGQYKRYQCGDCGNWMRGPALEVKARQRMVEA